MKKLIIAILLLMAITVFASEQTVTLVWDAPALPPAGYNLYSAPAETGPWTKLNDAAITELANFPDKDQLEVLSHKEAKARMATEEWTPVEDD